MKKKAEFKEWEIEILPIKNKWIPISVSRNIDSGVRRSRKSDGSWCMLSATRTKFYLAWNGERFAQSSDLKTMRNRFPGLFKAICDKLGFST